MSDRIRQIFKEWQGRLEASGNNNAKRSVEELLAHVLNCKPLETYFCKITEAQEKIFLGLAARAEKGEPIQYIIGWTDFYGLKILCDSRALIPRPETELLVEKVIESAENQESELSIIDVCTGTGCIALALANELQNAKITGIDISSVTLDLAKENCDKLGLSEKIKWLKNNLLDGVKKASADIVVSNPPYICSDVCKTLNKSVRDFEPTLALDGGEDGLDIIKILARQARGVLKPGGRIFLEIGYDQGNVVSQCLEDASFNDVKVYKDFAGHDRIVCAER